MNKTTLTRQAQARILRKHLANFAIAQRKATEALRAINEIALCENDGNPLDSALQGTEAVTCFAGFHYAPASAKINALLTEAQQALNASSHWASND